MSGVKKKYFVALNDNRETQLLFEMSACFSDIQCQSLNFRLGLPVQPIDATHALNRSAGVSYSSVLRGRSFNRRAMAFSFA